MINTERFAFRAAAYLLLIQDDKVLMLRRFNTGWRNGEYSLPAGHVDGGETIREALCREAKEEVGITVAPDDLTFAHAMHQHDDDKEYIDFYFTATHWDGELTNMEPHKCDDMHWFPLAELPNNIIPSVLQALTEYNKSSYYSEFGW